ncbi:hypothetical protein K435DRAFT_970342 [Dendrothele bispora CBS 962.96]|uniref:Uncharacterized protein n=1 Tax=Dendrothele bispora (strain CBS 962.96) TaxID=1314807 RepID=A0A4S8LC85_DENBC|nr:hypothetical protein K435DRAFT_970342 [Dendrothele bispora CBS 962.96]
MTTFFPQASQCSFQAQTINFVARDQNTHNHQVHTGDLDSIVSPSVPGSRSIFDDSAFSPGLVFYNDLIPVNLLWENKSAIVRCYIAHRIKRDINPLRSYDYFPSLVKDIYPDTGLFCVSPIHSFQDDEYGPPLGWTEAKEHALSPLPVTSYDDSYILSHYLKWARGDMSAELAFQKVISSVPCVLSPLFDHNPKQPVSLAVITNTALPTTPTIIGKFKNLQYRVVDEGLLHPSSIQNTQNFMFKTTDKKMEVTIRIVEKWELGVNIVGQRNEPSSETYLRGWARISYDQFWSHSTRQCSHCDHKWMRQCFTRVLMDGSSRDWLAATWLSQAQYFCNKVKGLYKDIPKSAALLSEVWFKLQPNYRSHHSLLHPNFAKIYLFIPPITVSCPSGTSEIDVCWGNDDNDLYYWSFDPDGSCPLSKRTTEALGLPELVPKADLYQQKLADYQYEATKQFQLFIGYNPSTQEFAQKHGLPLVDVIWPDGNTGPATVYYTDVILISLYLFVILFHLPRALARLWSVSEWTNGLILRYTRIRGSASRAGAAHFNHDIHHTADIPPRLVDRRHPR